MARWTPSTLFSPSLAVVMVTLLLLLQTSWAAGLDHAPDGSVSMVPTSRNCSEAEPCSRGVLLPVWEPRNPSSGDKVARATVYFVALVYMFLGVSIVADRFMASIEVITSQEKEITIKKPNGETMTTTVRIWNETVSNLTLMALGSSAPEILLSVIEVIGHGFTAGAMGPATIVGSAAFNMFVIIGICVYVVPDGETRKVKHLRVFFVTASWSIFAYIWLYLILAVISPGVVQVWEALLTLFFFPICVLFAWIADRRLLFYKYMYKHYRAGKHRGMIIETEGDRPLPSKVDIEMDGKMLNSHGVDFLDGPLGLELDEKDLDDEETRRDMAKILKELKQKHPDREVEQLIELANYQVLSQQQKSRAFYRCQATRLMTGAGNILKKHAADQARKAVSLQEVRSLAGDGDPVTRVFFEPSSYQCLENCGTVAVTLVRQGGDPDRTLTVDYRTEDGTANAGSDYEFTEGVVVFKPGETLKEVRVGIIDDDIFEEDESFLIHLSNLRVLAPDGEQSEGTAPDPSVACLGPASTATVTIFDDDHAGIFTLEEAVCHVSESVGTVELKVLRTSGARGVVTLPYKTLEGTARGGGEDFEDAHGVLEFNNDEIFKSIKVRIIDDEEYEKNKTFYLEIGAPHLVGNKDSKDKGEEEEEEVLEDEEQRRVAEMGRPMLGDHVKMEIIIEESYEFKNTVDKLIKKTNLALLVGTNSWRDQFIEAITVSAGEDDDDEDCGEEKLPSCFDYVMHFLTVFWKVLFAFVPPTDYWNGWACFVVSICMIGLLTAFIGDLASHFGCTVGLKDSVTAVVFVALGTSVPDTFASKVAAIQDQYADASIGNVTGSNAVNVFLGIGVAWSIAAIYQNSQGREFRVDPGPLAFSVTLFTIFAFISVGVLMYRRRPDIGGELGGPRTAKVLTTMLFVSLWLLYILFSSLEAYCHIKGF
ncbi:sodium/calcium exchanger 1b isoform X1 [Gadus macrocephalus]|uniref:sodium/calcium exchanger 1b isoform X1 n=1 Tax=Gadus macrocephalus TaxID=80720 RepID=UPI0028CB70EE|nr:sodium/calcium exchanger 1b isoform X1 [Gadus macrocephalus]XP_059928412.1 sodium/calcium exchanger 1b isoform X1 [Gadus macrocephalus]XP_059928413.1 sodium/calcium exchanger 1b isoform X1 [Gadus macrocephalus]